MLRLIRRHGGSRSFARQQALAALETEPKGGSSAEAALEKLLLAQLLTLEQPSDSHWCARRCCAPGMLSQDTVLCRMGLENWHVCSLCRCDSSYLDLINLISRYLLILNFIF
jgi:hypothetical protein